MNSFFIVNESQLIFLFTAFIITAFTSIILLVAAEFKKNQGQFNFTSLVWILLSLVFPIIIPTLYFIFGNLKLKR